MLSVYLGGFQSKPLRLALEMAAGAVPLEAQAASTDLDECQLTVTRPQESLAQTQYCWKVDQIGLKQFVLVDELMMAQ
jgi:hypothetical protein